MAHIKNIINAHLDIIELLNDEAKDRIDTIFDKLNMAEMIRDPDNVIDDMIAEILLIISSFMEPVISESERFTESVSSANKETT